MPVCTDNDWMQQALELAAQGHGLASPNPLVGAVVVRAGEVIGQAFHTYDGLKHAEVLAFEQAGERARGATLYINLEPCCHYGRTSPCSEHVLAVGVRRVVAAMADPNPAVSGKSFVQLRAAGVEISLGVREQEAKRLNEAFARYIRTGFPLVTLKAALTLDGKIAPAASASEGANHRWISSEASRAFVQVLRHQHDAVLTGVGTVLADNPLLSDRSGRARRRRLLRVVLDTRLRIPLDSKLVRTAENDVLVYASEDASLGKRRELEERGVEVRFVKEVGGEMGLRAVLRELAERQIISVLLEAGAHLNAYALEMNLVDKVFLFYAPKFLGGDDAVPLLAGEAARGLTATLRDYCLHRFGPDFAMEGYLRDVFGNH